MCRLYIHEIERAGKFSICAISFPPRDTGVFMTVSLCHICFLFKREPNHQTGSLVRIRQDRNRGIVKGERKAKMDS